MRVCSLASVLGILPAACLCRVPWGVCVCVCVPWEVCVLCVCVCVCVRTLPGKACITSGPYLRMSVTTGIKEEAREMAQSIVTRVWEFSPGLSLSHQPVAVRPLLSPEFPRTAAT